MNMNKINKISNHQLNPFEEISTLDSISLPIKNREMNDQRVFWALNRSQMETKKLKSHPRVRSNEPCWRTFSRFFRLLKKTLNFTGLSILGKKKALDIRLRRLELSFPDLPPLFDGYSILQISDLHLDSCPGITEAIINCLPKETVNLAVLTGDYRDHNYGPYHHVLPHMKSILDHLKTRDGFVAILGNHDSYQMVPELERLGIQVLVNETLSLERSGAKIHLTGLDDVTFYYTRAANKALEQAPPGFKIALIHSNEFCKEAAAQGYQLYLCGHTHGGQICYPTGKPIFTHTDMERSKAKGVWNEGKMLGYTSSGAGLTGLPIRLFCPGEVTLLTLRSENLPTHA